MFNLADSFQTNRAHAQTFMSSDSGKASRPTGEKPASLSELFVEEESALLRFAFGLIRRRELAEELVQEAFLRLHQHWEEVQNPRGWIYRCIRNLALNHLRDHAREQDSENLPEPGGTDPLPDETLSNLETCGHLRMLVADLRPEDRELLALKYNDHLGYAEISRRTGLGVGNVGYRLHHLLKNLAESLRTLGIESPRG